MMESNNTESWSKDFEIGVPKIDKQFYNLFSVFDDINGFKNSTQADYESRMSRIINRLERYANEIAVLDNSLVRTENSEDIDLYVVNSQKLLAKVDDFILHFNANNRLLLDQMTDFLKKWLMVQLLQADKVFGKD